MPHTSRFFVQQLQSFLSGSNRVKICRAISLPHTNRFLSRLTSLRFGDQYGVYSTDVTLMTFPDWLRRTRAPTNCLAPPHTSRQGPTRRLRSSTVRYRPKSSDLVVALSEFIAYWPTSGYFFVRRQKIGWNAATEKQCLSRAALGT